MAENATDKPQLEADPASGPAPAIPQPAPVDDTPAESNEADDAALPKRDLLMRGESAIARGGMVLASLLIAAMATSGWWTLQTQRAAVATARADQVRAVEIVLQQSVESMLSQGDVSAVRRLVVEAGRAYYLSKCRVVLPGNQIIASSVPSQINTHKLPPSWTGAATVGSEKDFATPTLVALTRPISVPGRGDARIELVGSVDYPIGAFWEAQVGVWAIGAASMVLLLIVYRSMRSRLRAMGAIRDALLALAGGERSLAALAVGPDLGDEADAWNTMLADRERLESSVAVARVKESIADRRVNRGDLESAFDAMSQGLLLINEKLQIKFINGAAAVLLQGKREEMQGALAEPFIRDENVMGALAAISAGTVRRRTTLEVKRIDEKTGSIGVLKFSVRPVRREDSAAAMVIIEDVTQQRVADEARNTFIAQATHELRTPLTNIRLYVETAIEEGDSNPAGRAKALNVINQEARRLENIVGEMLSVSEIEAGSFKLNRGEIRLDAFFNELFADYQVQAKDKQIRLKMNLPPKLPAIKGDRDKIVVALQNLLGNAIKYTPEAGQVTLNVNVEENLLTVEVIDTGIGIGEEDVKHVFDKFYRAKDPRVGRIVGTGLGLTLAREVVRLHGGDITVDSKLDKGSTFTLSLPISAEAV
jgi:signal transduction histidine kinase